MDLPKVILTKVPDFKLKLTANFTNISTSTKQSVKVSEIEENQSSVPKKRGPKRKLLVPIESPVVKKKKASKEQQKILTPKVQKSPIKKRGRPSKVSSDEDESSNDSFTEEDEDDEEEESVLSKTYKFTPKNNIKVKSQLNGDKGTSFYTSHRVRKPNPKFQDYITSSQVRSPSNVEKQTKEKPDFLRIKVKQRIKSASQRSLDKDPLDIISTETPPASKEDDTVRSFLPIMDKPKVLYDSDESKCGKVKSSKTRVSTNKLEKLNKKSIETETENEKSQIKAKSDTSNNTVISTQSDSKPSDVTTDAVTPVKSTSQTETTNSISTPVSSSTIDDSKLNDDTVNNKIPQMKSNNAVRKYTRIPAEKRKKATLSETKKKENIRYCLVQSEGVSYRTKSPKASDVDFNKLVRTLKSVKLPASNWKIRIVVSRQQTITEVTFTNKEDNERCVKFSRVFTGYVITFGKSVVKLVGAPNKISSFNDVTILLDIIHNLSLNDPILQYVSNKNL